RDRARSSRGLEAARVERLELGARRAEHEVADELRRERREQDAVAVVAARDEEPLGPEPADEREAVFGGGAEARPEARDVRLAERGHDLRRAREQAREPFDGDLAREADVLHRRARDDAPVGPRDDVAARAEDDA